MAITIYAIVTPAHIGLYDVCLWFEGNVPYNNTNILTKNDIEIEMTNVCFKKVFRPKLFKKPLKGEVQGFKDSTEVWPRSNRYEVIIK